MTDAAARPNESRERMLRREIPPRPIRAIAREAIADIDQALASLTDWGVKVPSASRLHQAREILVVAADSGVLVPSHRGDQLGLRALEAAFDYTAIAQTLPEQPKAALRRELRDSLEGSLEPPETKRGPLQLQSQAVVRAALVRGGLAPEHPTHSPKKGRSSPDIILENGLSRYAVEAKRPQLLKNVVVRFEEAYGQLTNFGLPGGILIDLADCLHGASSNEIDGRVQSVAASLYDRVFENGRGYRPGYSNLLLLGVYARVAWNSADRADGATVSVHTSSKVGVFATEKGTLNHHRARWIRKAFQDGLDALNRTLEEGSSPDATN